MASKTANVMARVEPQVKEQAEEIMDMLGIPVSVVINTLHMTDTESPRTKNVWAILLYE